MPANPFTAAKQKTDRSERQQGLDIAVVTDVFPEDHMVSFREVTAAADPLTEGTPDKASVSVAKSGDAGLPAVGEVVVLARFKNRLPVVLGTYYTEKGDAPTFTDLERIVGVSHLDSRLHIKESGDIVVESDGGATVTIANSGTVTIEAASGDKIEADTSDGSVRVNDGTNPVAYDVTTTKDGDGHVTSVTLVTSDKLKVPS